MNAGRAFAAIPASQWLGTEPLWSNGRFSIRATCGQCGHVKEISFSKRVSPDVAIPKIRQAGWTITGKNKCPECSKPKRENAVKSVAAPIAKIDPAKASDAAKRVRRLVYQALEDYYDDAKKCYRPSFSDATIAKELGASEAFVKSVRESDFGPIAVPTEVQELCGKLDGLAGSVASFQASLDALYEKNGWDRA